MWKLRKRTVVWSVRAVPSLRSGLAAIPVMLLAVGSVAGAAEVEIRVQGVTPSPSRVYVSLCAGSLDPADCRDSRVVAADGPSIVVRFADVSPGIYAAAAFQDINGNGVLDRSPRGLPREPYGFSRDAGRTASPRFDRAAFAVDHDMSVVVRLAAPGLR